MKYKAIVIGTSAGGLQVLSSILSVLPANFPLPVIIVQHRAKDERELLEEVLQAKCSITIRQVEEKEKIKPGVVYLAPADYHLLVEKDYSFSLSCDDYLHFSRPSIDILFETAAEVYEGALIGVILTGASKDGAAGIKQIRMHGGTTIAQDPKSAEYPLMPQAAINTGYVQYILSTKEIINFILSIGTKNCYEQ
jgi:two-component system chemotaxis response regulator CheB